MTRHQPEPSVESHEPVVCPEYRGIMAWFTRNRIAATLLAFAVSVAGLVALLSGKVRREVFPEVVPNIVTVQVPYLGATPAEVEKGVCMRVEEAVEGVTGIDKITSTANEGMGLVVVETLPEADLDQVLEDVKTRVDGITNFPAETEEPVVARLVVRKEVISVAIHGDADERTLKTLAERARDHLTALPAISQVELAAVRPYEISIEVSEAALQRWGLSFDQVAAAVRRSSLDLPGGAIKAAEGQTLLRVQGQAYRGEEFARLVLLTRPDGTRITLDQVATVRDTFADEDLQARFDGKPAALLKVFRVGDQDALLITAAVRDWVAQEGRSLLPHGVAMTTWRDESVILNGRINLLLRNALQGGVLVFVLLALFLQLRLAFWVTIGIPISFLGAIALMPYFHVSINLISLFAFLLVLGILVDDAIVVGENIFLHRATSRSPLAAALRGSQGVRVPVLASVLTSVAAFTPMFNAPGSDAQVWRVIPLVVIPVLLFSLMESQLCLPAHLSHIPLPDPAHRPWWPVRAFSAVQRGFQDGLQWFVDRAYQPFAEFCLRWRYLTLATAVGVLLLLCASAAAGFPRFVFFPSVDGDNIVVSLTMPQGTPVEVTSNLIGRIERSAQELRAEIDRELGHADRTQDSIVQHMMATVGSQPWTVEQARNGGQRDAQFVSGSHLGELNLQLLPSEQRALDSNIVLARLRAKVGAIPDAVDLQFTTSFFTTGKDVDIELSHDEMDTLRAAATDLKTALLAYPEVKDVADSFRLGKQELKLRIEPQAELLGLSQQDLARQVRQAFYGEEAQRVQRGRDDVKVMVRYPESARRSLADLDAMRIRTPAGDEVPFAEVAEAELGRAWSSINRTNRKRVLRVSGELDDADPNASPEQLNAKLRDEVLPQLVARHHGLSWAFEGDQKKKRDLLVAIGSAFVLALFLIYALMAIPLKSYLQPGIIMTAIPFGLGGAILGHMITGYDLSILSMFGIVALAGVVVNDNIVLVDWINQRREHHASLLDAVRDAGAQRFRPILLTSITTFGGLTPLLLEKSVQARFLVPMAVSLGFGVLFATAVSLLVVPSIYLCLDDLKRGFAWLYGRRPEVVDAEAVTPPLPPAHAMTPEGGRGA
jgi:multidrug efflux pump subunit AcrB